LNFCGFYFSDDDPSVEFLSIGSTRSVGVQQIPANGSIHQIVDEVK
jgi:hypothetical protein